MDWPNLEALYRRLAINAPTSGIDLDAGNALDAAIEQVILDTGWDADEDSGTVEVTASLYEAALLLAVSTYKAPEAPFGVAAIFDMGGIYVARQNPNYQRLLVGQRVRFPIG